MKKIVSAALALSLAAAAAAACTQNSGASNDSQNARLKRITPEPIVTDRTINNESDGYAAISDFCTYFHKIPAQNGDGAKNTLTSPLSAYIALSMTKEGASGETLEQLENVLGNASGEDLYALITHLSSLEETTLNIANSIWFDNAFSPQDAYLETLANGYLAEGFKTDIANAENDINLWIEEHTNGLIKNMLSDTALDSSVMALINTVYLKAAWLTEFSPDATSEGKFKNADGTEALTDFMYRKAFYKVIETDRYIGVSLPYTDGSLEFVALMPKDESVSSADTVGYIFDDGGWHSVLKDASEEKIKLYMPKFEQKMNGSLVELLKEMGITDAFSPDLANFSGIAENIFIEEVLQNAVLKIDEAGTEAAAATAIMVAPTSMPMPEQEPRVIEFNRPFTFAVVDSVTGAVLFCGEHNTAN